MKHLYLSIITFFILFIPSEILSLQLDLFSKEDASKDIYLDQKRYIAITSTLKKRHFFKNSQFIVIKEYSSEYIVLLLHKNRNLYQDTYLVIIKNKNPEYSTVSKTKLATQKRKFGYYKPYYIFGLGFKDLLIDGKREIVIVALFPLSIHDCWNTDADRENGCYLYVFKSPSQKVKRVLFLKNIRKSIIDIKTKTITIYEYGDKLYKTYLMPKKDQLPKFSSNTKATYVYRWNGNVFVKKRIR